MHAKYCLKQTTMTTTSTVEPTCGNVVNKELLHIYMHLA